MSSEQENTDYSKFDREDLRRRDRYSFAKDNFDPFANMIGDMAMNLALIACILIVAAIVGMIILVHYS
jgi:hypothetical protein